MDIDYFKMHVTTARQFQAILFNFCKEWDKWTTYNARGDLSYSLREGIITATTELECGYIDKEGDFADLAIPFGLLFCPELAQRFWFKHNYQQDFYDLFEEMKNIIQKDPTIATNIQLYGTWLLRFQQDAANVASTLATTNWRVDSFNRDAAAYKYSYSLHNYDTFYVNVLRNSFIMRDHSLNEDKEYPLLLLACSDKELEQVMIFNMTKTEFYLPNIDGSWESDLHQLQDILLLCPKNIPNSL
jgi:hypothetical protein